MAARRRQGVQSRAHRRPVQWTDRAAAAQGGGSMIPRSLFNELLANGMETARGRECDFHPVVKLFDPNGSAVWLLAEIDPAEPSRAYGLCDLGQGFPELGYVDLGELATVRSGFGLPVEIDR